MSTIVIHEHFIDDPLLPKLFVQSWSEANSQPRGTILITHGISEHSLCYDHVARALAQKGWRVFGWDLQGHGQSQGKRGYIDDFNSFSRDQKRLITVLQSDEKDSSRNFHMIGHSMGGLITLQTLLAKDRPLIRSAVLSNPALGIAMPVPKIKDLASVWLKNIWPSFTLNNEIRYELLSRDPQMIEVYSKDPLRHNKVSAPLYLGMKEAMESVQQNIHNLQVPVFFQISGQDHLVDPQASLDAFKKIQCSKELKVYEESFHEIYNDLNKQEGIDDVIHYLGE